MRCWEMRPGLFYMHRKHIYRTDGIKYFRRAYDVWSEKYLPVWEELYYEDLEPLKFEQVPPGTKFPLLP